MKKVLLYFAFVLAFVSQGIAADPDPIKKDSKREKNSGWFFGLGLGGGLNSIEDQEKESYYLSVVNSGKIGGYSYFNSWAGLRYYYLYAFNSLKFRKNGGVVPQPMPAYVINRSNTLNVDGIFSVYTGKGIDIGLIVGLGIGAMYGEFNSTYSNKHFFDYEFKANAGVRVMFEGRYGLELMANAHLPVGHPINIYSYKNFFIIYAITN